MTMLEDLMQMKKEHDRSKPSSEIGILKGINPLVFTINGQTYSSEDWDVYVPAVDRIIQEENILATTPDHTTGQTVVDVGDLELEPDVYERRFRVGDLLDITDRGNSFIIHGRLVKYGECPASIYDPTHRQ